MIKKFSAILLLTNALVACGQNSSIPESLSDVKGIVAQLDSAVTAMYGWEPRDSTYNHSLDTLVAGIMNEYNADNPEYKNQDGSIPAIQQQAYDEARDTWVSFKRLIDDEKYKEALDFYFGEKPNEKGKNAGDFLVFLKHSTQRYTFLFGVLLPLMREYKGDEYALKQYIEDLQLEKAIEELSFAMNEDNSGYVPQVYPAMVMDLGYALLADGRMDEAQDLFGDLVNSIYAITGDALNANFMGTKYAAHLYLKDGKSDYALTTWDNFKDYLEEYKSDYDEEELSLCLKRIELERAEIKEK